MNRSLRVLVSGLPLMVISGLLYAGLFVKPKPVSVHYAPPLFERDDRFYGIAAAGEEGVWFVGANGKIVHSDDGGRHWRAQASPVHGALQDIAAWDAQRAVAVGDQGAVLVTGDGGRTWSPVDAPRSAIADKLLRVYALPGGKAWVVGEGGLVLHSSDFGAHWARIGADEDVAWNGMAFHGDQAWLVGEFGRIRTSRDGGLTWSAVSGPAEVSLSAVAFRDALHGVAVGVGGTILTTHDGGARWQQVRSVTHEHLFDVAWDGRRWMIVGDKGVVLVAGETASDWRQTSASPGDRGWHTRIVHDGTRYYFSGVTPLVTEQHAL